MNQQSQESRNRIFSATFIVVIATLLSKISGLIRDQITASYFGISFDTDAFTWAYFIPNLFRVIFVESVIVAAFVPVYMNYLKENNKKGMDDFVSSVTNILVITSILISLLIFIFSAPIGGFLSRISGNNLDIAKFTLMNRIMIFSLVLMSLSGLFTSILNSNNKFTIPAIAPLVMNVISIIFVIALAGKIGIISMAIGIIIGSVLEVIIQIPQLRESNFKYKLKIDFKNKAVREIFSMMVPIMLSIGAVQINNSIDNFFALNLGAGNTTALTFSWRVANLPLGVFSVAIITVLYPLISMQAANMNLKGLKESFSLGCREIGYIMIPASVGMIILSNPIIKVLFERNQFTAANTLKVANILVFHCAGLVFFGLLMMLNRIFYSFKDVKTPLKVASFSMIVNFALDWLLIKVIGVAGVALSTSLVAVINAIILIIIFRKRAGNLDGKRILTSYLKIIVSTIIMGAVVFFLWKLLYKYFYSSTFMIIILLFILIVVGAGIYITLTYFLKMEEIKFVFKTLKDRVTK